MMNKSHLPSLIIAGQFPPPVHGFSYITQQMAELLSEKYEATVIDLVPHTPKNGVSYHLRRLFLAIKGAGTIIRHGLKEGKAPIYIACEGGLGLIYIIILAIAVRLVKKPLFLHHHSFNYIDNHIFLMSFLLKIIGKKATHIFLCPLMGERFAARYKRKIKDVVISNSAFVDEVPSPINELQSGQSLTIGLLSNLNEEKGLSHFIETLRKALDSGVNIKGVLAGPPVSDADRITIDKACQEFGESLDYRGPVYGKDKDAFFKDIDVFVFPTCYINEAQPTVIAEALSYGAPVLAYERGCICNQVGECGMVFTQEEDFSSYAVRWLQEKVADIEALNVLKTASRDAFLNDRKKALETAKNLLHSLPETIKPIENN